MADYWSQSRSITSYNIQGWEWAELIRALQFHFWLPSEHSSCTEEWQLQSQRSGLVAEFPWIAAFWGMGCAHLCRLALWTSFQCSHSGNVWIPPSHSRAGSQSWRFRCSDTSCVRQTRGTRALFLLEWGRWQLGDKTKPKALAVSQAKKTTTNLKNGSKLSWWFIAASLFHRKTQPWERQLKTHKK